MERGHIDIRRRAWRLLRQHPVEWLTLARTAWTTLKFRFFLGCAETGTIVGHGTQIINFSNVRIGAGCLLQDNVYMRAGTEGSIVLGPHVAINSFARFFGHGGIEIGAHSQIGPGSLLTTTTHDREDLMKASFRPISIGRWVWIGANVTVLSGVRIGDHCVVGAGSLVNRDLPDHSVAVGVPARVIERRLPEGRVDGTPEGAPAPAGGAPTDGASAGHRSAASGRARSRTKAV